MLRSGCWHLARSDPLNARFLQIVKDEGAGAFFLGFWQALEYVTPCHLSQTLSSFVYGPLADALHEVDRISSRTHVPPKFCCPVLLTPLLPGGLLLALWLCLIWKGGYC